MTNSNRAENGRSVIIGVDTHKHFHVAVAIDGQGVRIEERIFSASRRGYADADAWALALGTPTAFGIEGTGSYGAGLASHLRRQGRRIIEVNRGNRQTRRLKGKTDSIDAEAAARAVLAGTATAIPKAADGCVEMIRQIKIARDTAVKARAQAVIALKTLIVNSPEKLRQGLTGQSKMALIRRCAALRPGSMATPSAAAKHAIRALGRRWLELDREVREHESHLDRLTSELAPTLRQGIGIGPDTAAEMLIVFGDNPERIRSEAAFAKLCGACPIPASSGSTHRHRLYRGGHRKANAALYRVVIVRMRFHRPTKDYVARRTAEGLSKKDIIRCLKRYVAREVFKCVMSDRARFSTTAMAS